MIFWEPGYELAYLSILSLVACCVLLQYTNTTVAPPMHRRRAVTAATTLPAIAPAETGTWNWVCSEPGNESCENWHSTLTPDEKWIHGLVPRPFPPPVFDRLQYAKTEGEGLAEEPRA